MPMDVFTRARWQPGQQQHPRPENQGSQNKLTQRRGSAPHRAYGPDESCMVFPFFLCFSLFIVNRPKMAIFLQFQRGLVLFLPKRPFFKCFGFYLLFLLLHFLLVSSLSDSHLFSFPSSLTAPFQAIIVLFFLNLPFFLCFIFSCFLVICFSVQIPCSKPPGFETHAAFTFYRFVVIFLLCFLSFLH